MCGTPSIHDVLGADYSPLLVVYIVKNFKKYKFWQQNSYEVGSTTQNLRTAVGSASATSCVLDISHTMDSVQLNKGVNETATVTDVQDSSPYAYLAATTSGRVRE